MCEVAADTDPLHKDFVGRFGRTGRLVVEADVGFTQLQTAWTRPQPSGTPPNRFQATSMRRSTSQYRLLSRNGRVSLGNSWAVLLGPRYDRVG